VSAGAITQIFGTIVVPTGINLTASNLVAASGGSDIESAASIRRNIPNALLTVERACTEEDFEYLAEMVGGVERAGVKTECGRKIEVYIVPSSGGLASGILKQNVLDYLNVRKILGREIIVLSAGVVNVNLTLNVRLGATAQPSITVADIKKRIAERFSYLNQKINSTLYLSDITEVVENTRGVNSSDIVLFNAIPYARPINVQQNLDWSVVVTNDSTTVTSWRIVFLGNARYQLFRNNTFVGQFNVGQLVVKYGVQMTINSDVAAGAKFEFVTYRNVGNLSLNEMSVAVITEGSITINIV
jgi:hypothetical protein